MIRRLPGDANLEVERNGLKIVLERGGMERGLTLAEKVTLVGPKLRRPSSIARRPSTAVASSSEALVSVQ